MEKTIDIVGVGGTIGDIIVQVERLPGADEPMPMLAYSRQGGGMMATAIAASARLGAKCACISAVGDDAMGRFCLEDYAYHGIDATHCHVMEGKSTIWSVCIACKNDRTRNLITYRENAARPQLAHLDKGLIAEAKYLHIYDQEPQSQEVTLAAAKIAKESGTKVSVDAFRNVPFYDELISYADVWIASERYYNERFGDDTDYEKNLRSLYEEGPQIVIVTLGEKGLAGYDEKGFFQMNSFRVEVQDTTGAGDVYHGAFIALLCRGWDARKCAKYASAVSAIKCTRMGGRAAIPDFETLCRFVETGEIDYTGIDKRVERYRSL